MARPVSAPKTPRGAPRPRDLTKEMFVSRSAALRQRAIFSEVLIPDEGQTRAQRLAGPPRTREVRSTREARPLSAGSYSQRKRVAGMPLLKASEPVHPSMEPKVMESYRTFAGRCPRRLRIERLRKKYASLDVQKLLVEKDVDVSQPWYEDKSPLPLEAFDDTEYDLRTPEEWMDFCHDPSGQFKPLPALALWRDPDSGAGYWRRAMVLHYHGAVKKFEIQYEDDPEPVGNGGRRGMVDHLPRLRVMFRGEDPEVFANRVEHAYKSRRRAELLLRYNFFVDNMPTDDVQQLSTDQIAWLKDATTTCGPETSNTEWDFIVQEVQLDFGRAMNRITFDTHLLDDAKKSDPLQELLRPVAEQGPVGVAVAGAAPAPWCGRVAIPKHPFQATFANLCWRTLRVRSEVVLALQGIKGESERRLQQETIFSTDFSRPLRLDEFRQNLRSSCAEAALSLKEAWPAALQTTVIREFESIQKGWFNVHEKSVDLYRQGKLRRFLLLARLIMQDTLRNIAKNAVKNYVEALERVAPVRTFVESYASASCNYRAGAVAPGPIFAIEVKPTEILSTNAHFGYVIDPNRFLPTALEAYDSGLAILNQVYPLERLMIPPRLQSSDGPSLVQAFDWEESWVQDGRSRVQKCLEVALSAPSDYLQKVDAFTSLLRIEPAKYVQHFFRDLEEDEEEPSNQEVQTAIRKAVDSKDDLNRMLPDFVSVGMFQITIKEVRRALTAKHESMYTLLMERIVQRLRSQMEDASSDCKSLMIKITRPPKAVEELVQQRNSILTLSEEISAMRVRILNLVRLYEEIEEGFLHQLPPYDFNLRWELVTVPPAAESALARKAADLRDYEAHFVQILCSRQDALRESINEIEQTLELFRTKEAYWDVSAISMIREAMESLSDRIASAKEDAKAVNQMETMLERKLTEYTEIVTCAMVFEPFVASWNIVYQFRESRALWHDGTLTDADALRRSLLKEFVALEQAAKGLEFNQWPSTLLAMVAQQLSALDKFQVELMHSQKAADAEADAAGAEAAEAEAFEAEDAEQMEPG
eukprot:s353_g5.t1